MNANIHTDIHTIVCVDLKNGIDLLISCLQNNFTTIMHNSLLRNFDTKNSYSFCNSPY